LFHCEIIDDGFNRGQSIVAVAASALDHELITDDNTGGENTWRLGGPLCPHTSNNTQDKKVSGKVSGSTLEVRPPKTISVEPSSPLRRKKK